MYVKNKQNEVVGGLMGREVLDPTTQQVFGFHSPFTSINHSIFESSVIITALVYMKSAKEQRALGVHNTVRNKQAHKDS